MSNVWFMHSIQMVNPFHSILSVSQSVGIVVRKLWKSFCELFVIILLPLSPHTPLYGFFPSTFCNHCRNFLPGKVSFRSLHSKCSSNSNKLNLHFSTLFWNPISEPDKQSYDQSSLRSNISLNHTFMLMRYVNYETFLT